MERCTNRRVMAGMSQTVAEKGCRHLIDMLHNEFGESISAVRDIVNELNKLPSSAMESQESIARIGEALKASRR